MQSFTRQNYHGVYKTSLENPEAFWAQHVGVFPQAVVAVVQPHNVQFFHTDQTNERSIFDVASVTKSVVTTTLTAQLLAESTVNLYDTVRHFLPQASENFDRITLWHLLTHTSGLEVKMSSLTSLPAAEILAHIFSLPQKHAPGSVFYYQNVNSLLLGLVLEAASTSRLDQLAETKIFQPLGMRDSSFWPATLDQTRILSTELDARRGEVRGQVHDESTWALRPDVVSGAAGLFTTAEDLARYVQMLLLDGKVGETSIVPSAAFVAWEKNALDPHIGTTGLGWELEAEWMGECPPKTFGKTGFTGCSVVVNREAQKGVVILSNRTYPHRPKNSKAIQAFRTELHTEIWKTSV